MSMQLCLVNNSPIATVLITPDGQPLFSIETPHAPLPHLGGSASSDALASAPRPRSPTATTRIKRLERYSHSMGHTETEIGVVEYHGAEQGCHLLLSASNQTLTIPPHHDHDPCRTISESPHTEKSDKEGGEEEEYRENSWEFSTAECRERYTWKMFAHNPVLFAASNALMPVARYRRAKIGIVSRSRRAFLEIFPTGLAIIDLIVVTFVAFMKQRILIDRAEPTDYETVARQSLKPPSGATASNPEIPHISAFAQKIHTQGYHPPHRHHTT